MKRRTNSHTTDKLKEKLRFDHKAAQETSQLEISDLKMWLIEPYLKYYEVITKKIFSQALVLELGAGTGNHSSIVVKKQANLIALDISQKSLERLEQRINNPSRVTAIVADMEKTTLPNNHFDLVVCAGSLSYGEKRLVMNEIYRVLKKNGVFVCIDSLNENPIYRLNRFLHYLRGNRTKSTLKNMPDLKLLRDYEEKFGCSQLYFFGAITFLMPFLSKFLSDEICARISRKIDAKFRIRRLAFKFVMVCQKIR